MLLKVAVPVVEKSAAVICSPITPLAIVNVSVEHVNAPNVALVALVGAVVAAVALVGAVVAAISPVKSQEIYAPPEFE